MKTRSPAWKWFALGATVSVVLSVVATFYLVSAKLGQAGADPALAPPPLAVAASAGITFFSMLIPALGLCGAVIVIIDGYTRKAG
ncbi:MAG: hypothetical protein Q7R40_16765 [Phaeospirillum sp.]|nr:hypothetical protein [Phaeospirillum sp.]